MTAKRGRAGVALLRTRAKYVPGRGFVLDVMKLNQEGILNSGGAYVVVHPDIAGLQRGELQLLIFDVQKIPDHEDCRMLEISHMALSPHEQRCGPTQQILLQSTAPNFGGRRFWFTCPGRDITNPCLRRIRQLYLPSDGMAVWACTQCHQISTNNRYKAEGLTPNLVAAAKAIRCEKLYGSPEIKKLAQNLLARHLGDFQEVMAKPMSEAEKNFWKSVLADATAEGITRALVAVELFEVLKSAINRHTDFELLKSCLLDQGSES
jgi:hypothetical protein